MKQVHKEYERSFLLEPTKLTRIIDKIHERLDDQPHSIQRDHFEVFLAGDRREEMSTVSEVLALDNSRKHKIARLLVVCSASAPGAARPEHEVQVDFGGPKTTTTGDNKKTKVVAISIRSDAGGWASRTLSELEEQVERTWQNYLQPVLALLGILSIALVVLASQFISFRPGPQGSTFWLRGPDLDRIEALVGQGRTLTDEELREVATMQLRNLLDVERPKASLQRDGTRRLLLVALPLVVVLACIMTLLLTCYPKAVFLWGDEVDRYKRMLQRRSVVWGVIASVVGIGLLSKLFSEGVFSWLPQP